LFAFDGNAGFDAMAVQVAAFTGMIHQSVTVTKIDFLGDNKHDLFHPWALITGIYLPLMVLMTAAISN
jgi:hypothetical protein